MLFRYFLYLLRCGVLAPSWQEREARHSPVRLTLALTLRLRQATHSDREMVQPQPHISQLDCLLADLSQARYWDTEDTEDTEDTLPRITVTK